VTSTEEDLIDSIHLSRVMNKTDLKEVDLEADEVNEEEQDLEDLTVNEENSIDQVAEIRSIDQIVPLEVVVMVNVQTALDGVEVQTRLGTMKDEAVDRGTEIVKIYPEDPGMGRCHGARFLLKDKVGT